MTGYGQGSVELPNVRVTAEVRSVNNRFADLRLRIPSELAAMERGLRRKILARVQRGRVELSLRVERTDGADSRPVLNRALLQEVVRASTELRQGGEAAGELDLATVLVVPGMFRPESVEIEWNDAEREALEGAIDAAMQALDQDRLREGASLQTEIAARLDAMDGLTKKVRRLAEGIPSSLRDKILERLRALGDDLELDPARVAQEAAFLAERADVTEEIVRLEGHLAQARELVGGKIGDRLGKRLDFLLQEIHREVNTVGSKSTDLQQTRLCLELKAESEKIREQVQNLE